MEILERLESLKDNNHKLYKLIKSAIDLTLSVIEQFP